MKIVCGLGNPGHEYENHRHNVGFRMVDALAQSWSVAVHQRKFQAEVVLLTRGSDQVLLLKPLTFMNNSGSALGAACHFYRVTPPDVLVVHDELDLPFGTVKIKLAGGAAGHNGLKSVTAHLGSDGYPRLRVGIGQDVTAGIRRGGAAYVLSDFSTEESRLLQHVTTFCIGAIDTWIAKGTAAAMNEINGARAGSTSRTGR